MNQDPSRHPVTVEDLFRVKRAERPSPEFWEGFDRALRAKQLAAIVDKRPWWTALPRLLSRTTYWRFPLGATAVLAVTLLSLREHREPVPPTELMEPQVPAVAPVLSTSPERVASIVEANDVGAHIAQPSSSEVSSSVQVSSSLEEVAPVSHVHPGEIAAVVSLVDPSSGSAGRASPTPSAYSIARNLETAQAEEAVLMPARHFDSQLPATRGSAEPLAQVRSPSDVRVARLLDSALPTVAYVAAMDLSDSAERSTRRLDERKLYERVGRFGVDRGGVLVKF